MAFKAQSLSLSGFRFCEIYSSAFRTPTHPDTSRHHPTAFSAPPSVSYLYPGHPSAAGTVRHPRTLSRRSTFFWILFKTSPGSSTKWITTPLDTLRTWWTLRTFSSVSVSNPSPLVHIDIRPSRSRCCEWPRFSSTVPSPHPLVDQQRLLFPVISVPLLALWACQTPRSPPNYDHGYISRVLSSRISPSPLSRVRLRY